MHGLGLLLAPPVVGAAPLSAALSPHVASEVASSPVHGPEGPRSVHQLERVLVLLMVVGVLGAAGADGRVVFVDVPAVLVGRPCPVGYLQEMSHNVTCTAFFALEHKRPTLPKRSLLEKGW